MTRLIDADALLEELNKLTRRKDKVPEEDFYNLLNSAQTINVSKQGWDIHHVLDALLKISAELAIKQGMPDIENVEYSINIPKKSWRSISKMNDRAYEQCNEWSVDLNNISQKIRLLLAEPQIFKEKFDNNTFEHDYIIATLQHMITDLNTNKSTASVIDKYSSIITAFMYGNLSAKNEQQERVTND